MIRYSFLKARVADLKENIVTNLKEIEERNSVVTLSSYLLKNAMREVCSITAHITRLFPDSLKLCTLKKKSCRRVITLTYCPYPTPSAYLRCTG